MMMIDNDDDEDNDKDDIAFNKTSKKHNKPILFQHYLILSKSPRASNPESDLKAGNFSP